MAGEAGEGGEDMLGGSHKSGPLRFCRHIREPSTVRRVQVCRAPGCADSRAYGSPTRHAPATIDMSLRLARPPRPRLRRLTPSCLVGSLANPAPRPADTTRRVAAVPAPDVCALGYTFRDAADARTKRQEARFMCSTYGGGQLSLFVPSANVLPPRPRARFLRRARPPAEQRRGPLDIASWPPCSPRAALRRSCGCIAAEFDVFTWRPKVSRTGRQPVSRVSIRNVRRLSHHCGHFS